MGKYSSIIEERTIAAMVIKAYEGNEKYAFISYSHADRETVYSVLERLHLLSLRFWYDDGLHSEQWIERLVQKIESCEVMIVFLSENYYVSKDCNRELALAYEKNKELFVIKLDDTIATGKAAYILSGLNYFEYSRGSIKELLVRVENEDWSNKCRTINNNPILLKNNHSLDLSEAYISGPIIGEEKTPYSAWGPERKMHREESRPDLVSLNSELSSEYGDERFFVDIREQGSSEYYKEIVLESGKTYEVRFLYHNCASDESNKTGYGVATDTRAAVLLPIVVLPGKGRLLIVALQASMIDTMNGADEIRNIKVWGSVKLCVHSAPAIIQFKYASAMIENNGAANGSVLPTTLFSEKGTPLGFNKLTGTLPAGKEYAGYVHFKFTVY